MANVAVFTVERISHFQALNRERPSNIVLCRADYENEHFAYVFLILIETLCFCSFDLSIVIISFLLLYRIINFEQARAYN